MAKKQQRQQQTIIQQIVIRPPQRKTSDVGTWRNAMRAADNGRMKALYELFEDLLIDGVLSDAVDKRKDAICNSELTFLDKNGEEVTELTDLIDTLDFEELLRALMDVRFWGRAGVEFDFTDGFGVYQIPHKHINLNNQTILVNDTDDTGISYQGDDNILVIGKSRDYGLFIKTAPFAIWKRGGFGDYAQWLEIFGMPQRVGKYSSYDPQSRQLLEDALSRAGSAPWVVIPKESEVETVNNTGSGSSGTSYNDFRKSCNEEMLITVLGQTLTTIQGDKGARSLGDVHKEVEEGKNKADMRFIQRVLNQYLLPVLEKRGYPVSGGYFVFPEAAEQLSVSDIVSLSRIMDIPASFLHDKYSIPVPADGEAVAGSRASEQPDQNEPAQKEKESDKKKPDKKKLRDFFVFAPAQERGFATRLIDSITGRITLKDDDAGKYSIDLNKLLQEALNEIYGNETAGKDQPVVSKPLFDISNNALQHGIDKVFSNPDFGKKNRDFIDEFKHNTAVFSAFKNHRQTNDIIALLHDEEGNLRPFWEFKKLALQVSKDYNVNWLQTEYNTAVRSARSAVNYRKYLETEHLYPNLEYLESTAAHPRDSHLSYVGTILPIRHEWWDRHMPPSAWNCACSVRPTDKEATPVPGEEFVPPVFQNNPGKTAEFVNLKEHPYIKGVCPYSNTCLRHNYTGAPKTALDDKIDRTNPPVIPQCGICEIAKNYTRNLKRIGENRKKYEGLNKEWEKIFFNEENGGYLAIHKSRLAHSKINKQESAKYKKEKKIGEVFARNGFAIEMIPEPPRVPTADAMANGMLSDFKKTRSHNNIVKYVREDMKSKNAEMFFFEIEKETRSVYVEFEKLFKKYGAKAYFYFTGREDIVYSNF